MFFLLAEIKKFVGCHYSEQPELIGLTFLLALLVSLTIMLTVTAFHNRPFRCQWHNRDSPIMEDIAKVEDCRSQTSLLAKCYRPRSTVSMAGSKTSCEQNRETTIVKEIVMTTIPTPDIVVQSMLSSLSSSSPSSTLTSVKRGTKISRKGNTLIPKKKIFHMKNTLLQRHTHLLRNRSFLSAVAEMKTDVQEQTHQSLESTDTKDMASDNLSPSQLVSLANMYETPSNKSKCGDGSIPLKQNKMNGACRTNSPLYINVDSSLSLICPIDISVKRSNFKNNRSLPGRLRI